jgi:hypothetical protein
MNDAQGEAQSDAGRWTSFGLGYVLIVCGESLRSLWCSRVR